MYQETLSESKTARNEDNSEKLLRVLGVSNEKAKFIYAVLDLEKETRVDRINLKNLDVITAEVFLNRPFKNIDYLRDYLERHNIHGGCISGREESDYRLYRAEFGVAVHFYVPK